MMSYLWILLLGSLLASHAKAQDDTNPEDEIATTDPPLSGEVTEAAPEDDGAVDAEAETEPETTEAPLEEDEPETTPANSDAEAVDPAEGDTETVDPAEGDTETVDPAEGDAETVDPAEGDAEAVTPTVGDADAAVPTDGEEPTEVATNAAVEGDAEVTTVATGDPEPVTPAVDTEPEAAATTADANDPEAEQPAGNPVEETDESTEKTSVQEPGPDDNNPPAGDVTEEDKATSTDDSTNAAPVIPTIKEAIPPPKIIPETQFNLEDALDNQPEEKNQNKPPRSRSGMTNENHVDASESEKPQAQEGGSGSLAGILSAIVVSAVGAVSGYFAYQKKKLCFKNRQQADPEAAHKADAAEAQSDPQVLSTLLNSSKNQQ